MSSEIPPESSNSGFLNKKKKKAKIKNKNKEGKDSFDPPYSSASSSSCSSFLPSTQRGIRFSNVRRNPRVIIGPCRQKSDNVEALALPLGMSIAAVLAQNCSTGLTIDTGHESQRPNHLTSSNSFTSCSRPNSQTFGTSESIQAIEDGA